MRHVDLPFPVSEVGLFHDVREGAGVIEMETVLIMVVFNGYTNKATDAH